MATDSTTNGTQTSVSPERFATIPTWASQLSLREDAIRVRVDGTVAILGRSTRGSIQRFFAESHILERCTDLLENIPMANDQGYFMVNEDGQEIVYGNAVYLARLFGISSSEVWRRIKGQKGIDGRSSVGRTYRNAFFTESQVRPLVEDLLVETPKLNEEGWLIVHTDEGERRYGTLLGWSKEFGISRPTLRTKVDQCESMLVRNRQESRVKVYAEEVVREACGDLLEPLPKADDDDSIRLEQDGRAVEYRTLKGWCTRYSITDNLAERILGQTPSIRGKDRLGRMCTFYSEDHIKDAIPPPKPDRESQPLKAKAEREPLLAMDAISIIEHKEVRALPVLVADPEGFLVQEGCTYGTIAAWSDRIGLAKRRLYKKLRDVPTIIARRASEQAAIVTLYPEHAIRRIIERQQQKDVVKSEFLERQRRREIADSATGQLVQTGERYLTLTRWTIELNLSDKTVRRLARTLQPETGTDLSGRVAKLYGENAIRQACALALSDLPQADEQGFFAVERVRYGNVAAWSETLGISRKMLERLIKKEERRTGKDAHGRICEQSFYAEPLVRERCKEAILDLPRADTDGFCTLEGERWATSSRWARELKIDNAAMSRKIGHIEPKRGFAKHGVICDFLPESKVREACREILALPRTQPDTTFMIESERYATRTTWARILGIPMENIRERTMDMEGISAYVSGVGVLENAFLSETDIRNRCSDLLDFPKANENGFIEQDGKRFGTLHAWRQELGPCFKAMASRMKNLPTIKGRNRKNAICDFYEEQHVLAACIDLMKELPETDETGFITVDTVRYSTVHRLAETFSVASITMKRRLAGYTPMKGKTSGNKIRDFYKEEDARIACADLLSSRNGTD